MCLSCDYCLITYLHIFVYEQAASSDISILFHAIVDQKTAIGFQPIKWKYVNYQIRDCIVFTQNSTDLLGLTLPLWFYLYCPIMPEFYHRQSNKLLLSLIDFLSSYWSAKHSQLTNDNWKAVNTKLEGWFCLNGPLCFYTSIVFIKNTFWKLSSIFFTSIMFHQKIFWLLVFF